MHLKKNGTKYIELKKEVEKNTSIEVSEWIAIFNLRGFCFYCNYPFQLKQPPGVPKKARLVSYAYYTHYFKIIWCFENDFENKAKK